MTRWATSGVPALAGALALATALVLAADVSADTPAPADGSANLAAQQRADDAAVRTRLALERRVASALGASAATRRLDGRRVLLVAAPGAGTQDVHAALRSAGATVSGTVRLLPPYVDPARSGELEDLLIRLMPPGVTLPRERRATSVAAAVIARALLSRRRPDAAPSESAAALLAGLKSAGFARHDGAAAEGASQVVLVGSPTPRGGAPASDHSALVDLAAAVSAESAGAVVAGGSHSAAPGGLVAAVRGGDNPTGPSTVDLLDTAAGPSAVVLALAARTAGRAGHFGAGPGASALLPPLCPPRGC